MAPRPSSQGFQGSAPALIPQGQHAGKPSMPMGRPFTLIGSRHRAHLHLLSQTVSKAHAIIVNDGGLLYIRDTASREHVFINGHVSREAELKHGDLISIGTFLFELSDPASKAGKIAAPPRPRTAVLEIDNSPVPTMFAGRTLLIGRRPTCDVLLKDPAVSNVHAVIFELDGQHQIRDLGSRSGTFVNGETVHQSPLHFGDVIRIGEAEMRFEPADAAADVDELEHLVGAAKLGEESVELAERDAAPTNGSKEIPQSPGDEQTAVNVADASNDALPSDTGAQDAFSADEAGSDGRIPLAESTPADSATSPRESRFDADEPAPAGANGNGNGRSNGKHVSHPVVADDPLADRVNIDEDEQRQLLVSPDLSQEKLASSGSFASFKADEQDADDQPSDDAALGKMDLEAEPDSAQVNPRAVDGPEIAPPEHAAESQPPDATATAPDAATVAEESMTSSAPASAPEPVAPVDVADEAAASDDDADLLLAPTPWADVMAPPTEHLAPTHDAAAPPSAVESDFAEQSPVDVEPTPAAGEASEPPPLAVVDGSSFAEQSTTPVPASADVTLTAQESLEPSAAETSSSDVNATTPPMDHAVTASPDAVEVAPTDTDIDADIDGAAQASPGQVDGDELASPNRRDYSASVDEHGQYLGADVNDASDDASPAAPWSTVFTDDLVEPPPPPIETPDWSEPTPTHADAYASWLLKLPLGAPIPPPFGGGMSPSSADGALGLPPIQTPDQNWPVESPQSLVLDGAEPAEVMDRTEPTPESAQHLESGLSDEPQLETELGEPHDPLTDSGFGQAVGEFTGADFGKLVEPGAGPSEPSQAPAELLDASALDLGDSASAVEAAESRAAEPQSAPVESEPPTPSIEAAPSPDAVDAPSEPHAAPTPVPAALDDSYLTFDDALSPTGAGQSTGDPMVDDALAFLAHEALTEAPSPSANTTGSIEEWELPAETVEHAEAAQPETQIDAVPAEMATPRLDDAAITETTPTPAESADAEVAEPSAQDSPAQELAPAGALGVEPPAVIEAEAPAEIPAVSNVPEPAIELQPAEAATPDPLAADVLPTPVVDEPPIETPSEIVLPPEEAADDSIAGESTAPATQDPTQQTFDWAEMEPVDTLLPDEPLIAASEVEAEPTDSATHMKIEAPAIDELWPEASAADEAQSEQPPTLEQLTDKALADIASLEAAQSIPEPAPEPLLEEDWLNPAAEAPLLGSAPAEAAPAVAAPNERGAETPPPAFAPGAEVSDGPAAADVEIAADILAAEPTEAPPVIEQSDDVDVEDLDFDAPFAPATGEAEEVRAAQELDELWAPTPEQESSSSANEDYDALLPVSVIGAPLSTPASEPEESAPHPASDAGADELRERSPAARPVQPEAAEAAAAPALPSPLPGVANAMLGMSRDFGSFLGGVPLPLPPMMGSAPVAPLPVRPASPLVPPRPAYPAPTSAAPTPPPRPTYQPFSMFGDTPVSSLLAEESPAAEPLALRATRLAPAQAPRGMQAPAQPLAAPPVVPAPFVAPPPVHTPPPAVSASPISAPPVSAPVVATPPASAPAVHTPRVSPPAMSMPAAFDAASPMTPAPALTTPAGATIDKSAAPAVTKPSAASPMHSVPPAAPPTAPGASQAPAMQSPVHSSHSAPASWSAAAAPGLVTPPHVTSAVATSHGSAAYPHAVTAAPLPPTPAPQAPTIASYPSELIAPPHTVMTPAPSDVGPAPTPTFAPTAPVELEELVDDATAEESTPWLGLDEKQLDEWPDALDAIADVNETVGMAPAAAPSAHSGPSSSQAAAILPGPAKVADQTSAVQAPVPEVPAGNNPAAPAPEELRAAELSEPLPDVAGQAAHAITPPVMAESREPGASISSNEPLANEAGPHAPAASVSSDSAAQSPVASAASSAAVEHSSNAAPPVSRKPAKAVPAPPSHKSPETALTPRPKRPAAPPPVRSNGRRVQSLSGGLPAPADFGGADASTDVFSQAPVHTPPTGIPVIPPVGFIPPGSPGARRLRSQGIRPPLPRKPGEPLALPAVRKTARKPVVVESMDMPAVDPNQPTTQADQPNPFETSGSRPIPLAAPMPVAKAKKRWRFPFLGVAVLAACSAAVGGASWLALRPRSDVQASIRFDNLDALESDARLGFLRDQSQTLESAELLKYAQNVYVARHPDAAEGGLLSPATNLDAAEHDAVLQSVHLEGDRLVMQCSGTTEPQADADRLHALLVALYTHDKPMADKAAAAKAEQEAIKAELAVTDQQVGEMQKRLADDLARQSSFELASSHEKELSDSTAQLGRTWSAAAAATRKLRSEFEALAAPRPAPAASPEEDDTVKQLTARLAGLNAQLHAAEAAQAPVDSGAFDSSLAHLHTVIEGFHVASNDGAGLPAYIALARQAEDSMRKAGAELTDRQKASLQALADLKRTLAEKIESQRKQAFASDPALTKLQQDLAVQQHRLGAAASANLSDDAGQIRAEVDRLTAAVNARRGEIASSDPSSPEILAIRKLIGDQTEQMHGDLTRNDQRINEQFSILDAAAPKPESLPFDQRPMLAMLVDALQTVDKAHIALSRSLTPTAGIADARLLQSQAAETQAQLDARKHQLAGPAVDTAAVATAITEKQVAVRAAETAEAKAFADWAASKRELAAAQAALTPLKSAAADMVRDNNRYATLRSHQEELANRVNRQTRIVAAVPRDPDSEDLVKISPLPNHRLLGFTAAGVLAAFTVGWSLAALRGGDASTHTTPPATPTTPSNTPTAAVPGRPKLGRRVTAA